LTARDTDDAVVLEELRVLGRADRIATISRVSGGSIADVWLITYADGTQDFTQTDRRIAVVKAREVRTVDSIAEVVSLFGNAGIKPGDAAVLL